MCGKLVCCIQGRKEAEKVSGMAPGKKDSVLFILSELG